MRRYYFALQIFAVGGGDGAGNGGAGAGAGSAGNGNGGQGNAGGALGRATYSYEQAEQIAEARADRATKAALADYFKRQGMSEEEAKLLVAEAKSENEPQEGLFGEE